MKQARSSRNCESVRVGKHYRKYSPCRAAGWRWKSGRIRRGSAGLLREMEHEVIVANARNVRLIGESRKKDDRLDAQTLARLARIDPKLLYPVKHSSIQGQADLTVIRARAALVRARTRRTFARLQRAQYESGKSGRVESRAATRTGALEGYGLLSPPISPKVLRAGGFPTNLKKCPTPIVTIGAAVVGPVDPALERCAV